MDDLRIKSDDTSVDNEQPHRSSVLFLENMRGPCHGYTFELFNILAPAEERLCSEKDLNLFKKGKKVRSTSQGTSGGASAETAVAACWATYSL